MSHIRLLHLCARYAGVCTTMRDAREVCAGVHQLLHDRHIAASIAPPSDSIVWRVARVPYGERNPDLCDGDPERIHWLLEC